MTDPRPTVTLGVEAPRSSAGGIVAFLVLTFAVTWSCYITAAVQSGHSSSIADPGSGLRALILLGTITPSLIALALTGRAEGAAGIRILLGRILRWV